jgi:hypothetical protein
MRQTRKAGLFIDITSGTLRSHEPLRSVTHDISDNRWSERVQLQRAAAVYERRLTI